MKRYRVTTSKVNLQSINQLRVKHLKVLDEKIEFVTDQKGIEKLKDLDIEYDDLTTLTLKKVLKKYMITIIGLILITVALINQSVSIVEVRFTNPDTYDEDVVNYLEKYYRKIGPFRYLTADLTDINFDLRSQFYEYEWIGLSKKGSILYLDIKKLVNEPIVEDKRTGSYYSKYDSIVKKYHIEKGIVVVQEEQFVAKGELLISGKITHLGNKIELIRAKGYVIGEVLQYKDYKIPKVELNVLRTGRMEKVKEYYLFNKKLGKDSSSFSDFNTDEGSIFKLPKVFEAKTVYRYEIKEIKNTYNQAQAIEYAKSLVYKEFRSQKINAFEKIIFNNLVKILEDDNYYYVRLIVKSNQNIAEFVPD